MPDSRSDRGYNSLLQALELDSVPKLLGEALTHPSYANDEGVRGNGRLGFMGDALVTQVLVQHLYHELPETPQSELTVALSSIRHEKKLAETARQLRLGSYLLLGQGEEASGGRDKSTNLANALQAVLAAVREDPRYGMQHAKDLLLEHHAWAIRGVTNGQDDRGWKNRLDAWRRGLDLDLSYQLVHAGPEHDRRFYASIVQGGRDGEPVAEGLGTTKKTAELEAARKAVLKYEQAFRTDQPPKRAKPKKKKK